MLGFGTALRSPRIKVFHCFWCASAIRLVVQWVRLFFSEFCPVGKYIPMIRIVVLPLKLRSIQMPRPGKYCILAMCLAICVLSQMVTPAPLLLVVCHS